MANITANFISNTTYLVVGTATTAPTPASPPSITGASNSLISPTYSSGTVAAPSASTSTTITVPTVGQIYPLLYGVN